MRKLRQGKAPLREKIIPMHGTSIQDLLQDLEEKAGVTHEKGRAWHGLRRAMTDLYPEATADTKRVQTGESRMNIMRTTPLSTALYRK